MGIAFAIAMCLTSVHAAQSFEISTTAPIWNTTDKALSLQFTLTGTSTVSKKFLIVGLGTSLHTAGALKTKSVLSVYKRNEPNPGVRLDQLIGQNSAGPKPADVLAAVNKADTVPLADDDAAVLVTLSPGSYTVILKGTSSQATGLGRIKVYDLVQDSRVKITHYGSQAYCKAKERVTLNFRLEGSGNTNVLVRAIGPTLKSIGSIQALANPEIWLMQATGAVIKNQSGWDEKVQAATVKVGALPLYYKGHDDALTSSLAPGKSYYVITQSLTDTAAGKTFTEVWFY